MLRALTLIAVALTTACGAAPVREDPPPRDDPPAPVAARFAGHGALVLRSASPGPQPPFYAELAADGEVTGTRCGATRFTDDGVLERDGVVVARVVVDGETLVVVRSDGTPLGWRIDGGSLQTGGAERFRLTEGAITPVDAELPSISVDPVAPELALALFATLLVCDDVGP